MGLDPFIIIIFQLIKRGQAANQSKIKTPCFPFESKVKEIIAHLEMI